jgi:hypothetical protein
VVSLVKLCAGLKNLRPAPGDMGVLKQITLGTERCYLNDSWSHLTFDPTSKFYILNHAFRSFILMSYLVAWKVHFEGRGKGVYKHPKTPVTAGRDLNALSNSLIQQQKDFLQAAAKITNGQGNVHSLKDDVHLIADETNGELDGATDLEGDSDSVVHQIIPAFEDEHHETTNTVHEVSFSSFSHSYERDHDRDVSYGLTRDQ